MSLPSDSEAEANMLAFTIYVKVCVRNRHGVLYVQWKCMCLCISVCAYVPDSQKVNNGGKRGGLIQIKFFICLYSIMLKSKRMP